MRASRPDSTGKEYLPFSFPEEFTSWIESASRSDLDAVQGFLLGDFDERARCASAIRRQSRAPIIALADSRSLEQTLVLFDAGIDDVLPKPVHVREILARAEAIWRRVNGEAAQDHPPTTVAPDDMRRRRPRERSG